MAAFQIAITPPAKKVAKVEKPTEFITPKLILAPFNPTPEVFFGSVTINARVTKSLGIYNPSATSISVQLRNIDAEDRITLSDSALQLNAREEKEIYISWSPIQSGYLRKVVRVQDASRKARSFDVILNGTCVSNNANDKRRRLKDENNKPRIPPPHQKKSDSTIILSQKQQKMNHVEIPLRRQTYSVEEKENQLPNDLRIDESIFRTSSPKYQNSNTANYSNDNLRSFDNIDAPTKYSNFELELRFDSEISNLHSSEGTNSCRRSTYGRSSEEHLKNPFSLSSVDELDSSFPHTNDFSDSLYKDLKTPLSNEGNITFGTNHIPENNAFTPLKRLSGLLSPPTNSLELLQTPQESTNLNITSDLLNEWSLNSNKKTDILFISPPTKTNKQNKKSPEYVVPRRNVSSAISDRKKHLKANILPRRKTPPSVIKKTRVIPSVEKMKTQDPSALKQVLRSHIDDPFLRQSLYCDEHWINRQERDIIKWMNSLLTPPIELKEENDWTVDAAEVWLKSRCEGDLRAVPSIDNIAAAVYHSPQRLDTLRKVASSLLTSEPVRSVFEKISIVVEKKIISIREDRDLHLDQGLRNKLMQLVSSYNPLWLQIALEAIYNQKITRQGKSDVGGLGWFIRKHLLTSSITNKKNAHPAVLQIKKPNYKDHVKKYILKKFLCLIYFLDQAKMRKLIRHNPCLFILTSECKSSQDLLLAFCGDLVVGRGDITKHLKAISYILQYRQTCIDEYDYSITSLHDLKDGVRLTRLFEILFNEPDLCSKLRVPAISILQKIYNVSVAMKVAKDKCTIEGDITAKEIVSGHREKILSFLWQIINNYLTPLYEKAAIRIQNWWRTKLIIVRLKRFNENKFYRSATVIQSAWRGYLIRKKFKSIYSEIKEQIQAANTLKRFFKSIIAQKEGKRILAAVRRDREISNRKHDAAVILQKWWRSRSQRKKFLEIRMKVVSLQRLYRANKLSAQQRSYFLTMKKYAILIQQRFRANRTMRLHRQYFVSVKTSTIIVQRKFRANKKAKMERERYLKIRKAVIYVQRKFRANRKMKKERESYNTLKTNVLFVQQKFRAKQAMIKDRARYGAVKMAAICVQRRFRANQSMKRERKRYLELRNKVLFVQRKYRATQLMKYQRGLYLKLKNYCMIVQRRFRENQKMKLEQNRYQELRQVTISIQRIFRAKLLMKADRDYYTKLKSYAILTQRRFRAKQIMLRERKSFSEFKQVVICVQRRFRANRAMKQLREKYDKLRASTILVQRKFRATRDMKTKRRQFVELRGAAVTVQNRFRANKKMKETRKEYLKLRDNVIFVQRRFRSNLTAKKDRNTYLNFKSKVVVIQEIFRANRAMKVQRNHYLTLKENVIKTQQRYRAILTMRKERKEFLHLRASIVRIQRLYRAKVLMQKERENFLSLKSAVLTVEKRFKRKKEMKYAREEFLKLKHTAIILQRRYRAMKEMKEQKAALTRTLKAVKTIQTWYRCQRYRRDFSNKKKAAIIIQNEFRAWKKMICDRTDYLKLKYTTCFIQNRYIISKKTRDSLKKFSLECGSIELNKFSLQIRLKNSIKDLETGIDAIRRTTAERTKFLNVKIATIFIQRCFRNKLRLHAERLQAQKTVEVPPPTILSVEDQAAIKIQARWRGYNIRRKKSQRKSATVVVKKQNNPNLDTKVTLGERYKKAILQMKTSDMYDVITHALWNLESVTTLSAKLCEGVVAEGIIPIIFDVMARGNRSEPSLEIYRAGCSILINLARYQPTKITLWENINKVDDLYQILHIMKITYDKLQVPVFRHAATLLWLLCQDVSAARIVADLYSFKQQIEKMLETLKRKSMRNPHLRQNLKRLPKIEADWYPEPENKIFDNNYVAILNVHRILYNR